MSVSIHRLRRPGRANDSVGSALSQAERALMINSAEVKLAELFDVLQIDHRNDHNTRDTPRRVAKMFVEEIMRGRYCEPPILTEFENVSAFDQLIVTGPIEIRSTCAHHLMPIYGDAYIGVLPATDGRIIGLSKYDRVVHYFAARLQIQEELVKQIGDFIVERTGPRGLAVRISAVHMCKTHRGVRASHRSRMVTTAYFGAMAEDDSLKQEFLQECVSLQQD
ncbi:MAG: GTP cyclohydrolase I [Acetobacteraceae bacterium]